MIRRVISVQCSKILDWSITFFIGLSESKCSKCLSGKIVFAIQKSLHLSVPWHSHPYGSGKSAFATYWRLITSSLQFIQSLNTAGAGKDTRAT